MTNVTFYVCQKTTLQKQPLACRLIEKSIAKDATKPIAVILPTDGLQAFSDDLWQIQTGFFAHHLHTANGFINLTDAEHFSHQLAQFNGIIFNLTDDPIACQTADRIIEIISADDASKISGRKRYKSYQSARFTLNTFNI